MSNSRADKKRKKRQSGGEGVAIVLLMVLLFMVIAFMRWQVAVLILGGMFPTFILMITGRGIWHTQRLMTVGLLNLAGIVPYALRLWDSPESFQFLASNILTWLLMWGAASLGYMLLFVGPFMASVVVQHLNKERLKKLLKIRQATIDEWGPEVAHAPESTKKK